MTSVFFNHSVFKCDLYIKYYLKFVQGDLGVENGRI